MKNLLVINESSLLRDFLGKQLGEYGFNVQIGINGLDGWMKIRQNKPDLIIMDSSLSRKSSMDILRDMQADPNLPDIPIIMLIVHLEKQQVVKLAQMGVRKLLSKPVRIDALLDAITEMLHVTIQMDPTPCLLDAHLNDQIMFVEIAQGFNREKINLLRYKIVELIRINAVQDPRILVLLTDINFRKEDRKKLDILLEEMLEFTSLERLRVLTVSPDIHSYLSNHVSFSRVAVVKTLEEAMEGLLGIEGMESLTAEQDNVQQRFFSSKQEIQKETFQLNFKKEQSDAMSAFGGGIKIAVADDDLIVRKAIEKTFESSGCKTSLFANGADFMEALERGETFDLLFLDLIMPKMNGFAVLQMLEGQNMEIPTIILTGVSRKESVLKARKFGVTSYLIKPIKPEEMLAAAMEILGVDL